MSNSSVDPYELSFTELKAELKKRDQSTKGNKSDLINRLVQCIDEEDINGALNQDPQVVHTSEQSQTQESSEQPLLSTEQIVPSVSTETNRTIEQNLQNETSSQLTEQYTNSTSLADSEEKEIVPDQSDATGNFTQLLNRINKFGTTPNPTLLQKLRQEKYGRFLPQSDLRDQYIVKLQKTMKENLQGKPDSIKQAIDTKKQVKNQPKNNSKNTKTSSTTVAISQNNKKQTKKSVETTHKHQPKVQEQWISVTNNNNKKQINNNNKKQINNNNKNQINNNNKKQINNNKNQIHNNNKNQIHNNNKNQINNNNKNQIHNNNKNQINNNNKNQIHNNKKQLNNNQIPSRMNNRGNNQMNIRSNSGWKQHNNVTNKPNLLYQNQARNNKNQNNWNNALNSVQNQPRTARANHSMTHNSLSVKMNMSHKRNNFNSRKIVNRH
ncbi:hypothetical protein WA158_002009 [Blastocystis sp. Blastoise]